MIKLRKYTKLFVCVFFRIFVILSNGNKFIQKGCGYMLGIKKRDTKQVFKAIAHQQGVSVSEVKERIQSTIDEMYYSDDPDVQAEFSSYFGKKRPTPEEYVYTIATKIKY